MTLTLVHKTDGIEPSLEEETTQSDPAALPVYAMGTIALLAPST